MNIYLQDRDLKMLRFISDLDFVTSSNLKNVFFKANSQGTCLNRLLKLRKSGFLKCVVTAEGKRLYQVTKKSTSLLRTKYSDKIIVDPPTTILLETLEHALGISKIREFIENNFEVRKWSIDRHIDIQLKSEGKNVYVPDSLIRLSDGKLIVLEFERVQKTKKRIEKRLAEVEQTMNSFRADYDAIYGLIVTNGKSIYRNYVERNINNNVLIQEFEKLSTFNSFG